MRKVRRKRNTSAPIIAPTIAPVFDDLFRGMVVVDTGVTPPSPDELEADREISEYPSEDTPEEDVLVNTGVTLCKEVVVDGVETVGVVPGVMRNFTLSARTFVLLRASRARREYPILSTAIIHWE
jgi:hypothetical protein